MFDMDIGSLMTIRDTALGVWFGMLAVTATMWLWRKASK